MIFFLAQNISKAPWTRADLNVHLMKYVSIGPAGIFSSAKDESIKRYYNFKI